MFVASALMLVIATCFVQKSFAQSDRPYTEGPLWQVQFIKTKPGMEEMYLKNLADGWIKIMRAAKDAGYIMDFKVLSADPASENDWDLMLMYEIKNYAMLDGATEKMDALNKKVFGGDDNSMHQQAVSRNDLRTLQGGKLTQQLDFK